MRESGARVTMLRLERCWLRTANSEQHTRDGECGVALRHLQVRLISLGSYGVLLYVCRYGVCFERARIRGSLCPPQMNSADRATQRAACEGRAGRWREKNFFEASGLVLLAKTSGSCESSPVESGEAVDRPPLGRITILASGQGTRHFSWCLSLGAR